MKTIGFVQAKMDSKRLPGKAMMKLRGKPIIEWVLERVLQAKYLDEVILLTTYNPQDDVLCDVANRLLTVPVHRYNQGDVLGQFVLSAREREADLVVRICGDNPLISPDEIDRLVEQYQFKPVDYLFNHLGGLGAEAIDRKVLEEVNDAAVSPYHREHVTAYIWDHLDAFSVGLISDFKFGVDTQADLDRLETFLAGLGVEPTK